MNDRKKTKYRAWIVLMLLLLLIGILLISGGLKDYLRNFSVPNAPRHTAMADFFRNTVNI